MIGSKTRHSVEALAEQAKGMVHERDLFSLLASVQAIEAGAIRARRGIEAELAERGKAAGVDVTPRVLAPVDRTGWDQGRRAPAA